MSSSTQQERAERLRQLHHAASPLVLPNVWDAASARVIEQAGFPAIATTSSGVAVALGYQDGQRISRELLLGVLARITRVVTCPVTADIESGYGASIAEVVATVKAVMETGVVGINLEDSLPSDKQTLTEIAYQVELIQAVRALATELNVPLVINARTDVFLRSIGEPEGRIAHAVQRAHAYLQAGADCIYPIGRLDRTTIATLVKEIPGPINIMGGSPSPTLPELAELGVARVSLAGGVMRAMLGHLRAVANELREHGTYATMSAESFTGAELDSLFE
jgi:2-methylisocitrate lyase-like PEP mutase family enzyme